MGSKELNVKLLRYTPNAEEIVAMGARLCYSAASIDEVAGGIAVRDQGDFIRKLMDMGHHTPFEHVTFTFGVEGVSRSLLAQITRHRIASFSVQSQRYVGETSTQNRGETFGYIVPQKVKELGQEAEEEFHRQMQQIQEWYDGWVQRFGGDRSSYEDARFVLPNAAETKLVVTMNARELMHFFNLRCCNRAQWEIRRLAHRMLMLVKEVAPTLFAKSGPRCLQGTCPEGKLSCGQMKKVRLKYLAESDNSNKTTLE
ncbi:FAD-dependent thymidylate synthase [Desulfofalx alkaliphila]|uniref:FAD-dependent thymidylate synthase n=1 Tax=Desulfofalx alkaliphila TaxID=105483 RepID=UPI0004E1F3A3|nr:FAD-dependent thymidylate synthase [Desulfofalx alkaliphila]